MYKPLLNLLLGKACRLVTIIMQVHAFLLQSHIQTNYQTAANQRQQGQSQSNCSYFTTLNQSHTHQFNSPLSRTTRRVSRYQIGETNLDFTEARESGSGISWAICKSATRSRQITTPAPHHSVFLQAGCPSCCPTNSVKALKAPTACMSQTQGIRLNISSQPALEAGTASMPLIHYAEIKHATPMQ